MATHVATDELTVRADGEVRIVTMNRPDKLNAFTESMHQALTSVWSQLSDSDDAKVVILTGAGDAFSAGGDLDWLVQINEDPARQERAADEARTLLTQMLRFPLPVIAAVNGPAVGLGCSLTVLADIVLLADSAYLADPHVSVGLAAGDGGLLWPMMVSMHRAKEFLFTGDPVDASRALMLGLANQVVPADDLMETAMDLARRLARQPARALRDTKLALNTYQLTAAWGAIESALAREQIAMGSAEHGRRLAKLRRRSGR